MKRVCAVLLVMTFAAVKAKALQPGGVQLLCHRTANQDVPENTLESLEQAALLGCNVVELDVRRTLDGELVLNHDGVLERLTDGIGEAEKTYYGDLQMRDLGGWMGDRFTGMRIVRFEDALSLARKMDIRLVVDMKTKGTGADVLSLLQREGMLERVQFNGEWADVKQLYPAATDVGTGTAWVQPGVTAEQVKAYHHEGKAVVTNFSANDHQLDLASMKAAVAAGVDGINVDYPRLGADAVGRPVERKINDLEVQASSGESLSRAKAILTLSKYSGFPLQERFARWMLNADDNVSRAAALALVTARPQTPVLVFAEALRSNHQDVRANAAWALGMLHAPANMLLPLLADKDPRVLQETLMALVRAPGDVSAAALLPLLSNETAAVRGAAALALAQHQPEVALGPISRQMRLEMKASLKLGEDYERRGKPQLTQPEIDEITSRFRSQMKMVQALSMLKGPDAIRVLEELAFQSDEGFTQLDSVVAGFKLWDRIGTEAQPAIDALGSSDSQMADRTEWMLVQAGKAVLPDVRKALGSEKPMIRERAIRIVAWQGDTESLETLRTMQKAGAANADLLAWAIEKIKSLHPKV
ncbi:glycerophosphodiester phosphodiesterase [Granulicella sp. WH15]|uniref:glycerophosphodiester phosphodiesterase family protein n=1 Tax=Granulicella sp. WH15 TaxID=2602070 RepID=UPI0013677546|nr:glycerophosphodiester phosphodiesterase family protein [Granulicella sp. WH15]QHN03571.1 glycerophosphodiester phosphodiesterase [Granulicella sp. WH15]